MVQIIHFPGAKNKFILSQNHCKFVYFTNQGTVKYKKKYRSMLEQDNIIVLPKNLALDYKQYKNCTQRK